MNERIFDVRPSLDPRNKMHLMQPLVRAIPKRFRSYTWRCHPRLNQFKEGACVGFGWAHEAAAKPILVPDVDNEFAREIYRAAQRVDEWPSEDYEGTSVNAGAKVMRERGFITEWKWATTVEEVMYAVGHTGPVVIGVPWLESMSRPGAYGYIFPHGEILGWHCTMINSLKVDRTVPLQSDFVGLNSWGTDWGVNGTFRIRARDLGKLMNMGGEVCVPLGRGYGR